MKLENEFTVPVDIDTVFDALNDPEKVAPCFPGATLDSRDGDDFTGTVKVKLGPISMTYKGKGTFVERDDQPQVVIDAQGSDSRGNGTASAKATATMTDDGRQDKVNVLTEMRHGQAGPVRPRRHGRRRRQDPRPVRVLPRRRVRQQPAGGQAAATVTGTDTGAAGQRHRPRAGGRGLGRRRAGHRPARARPGVLRSGAPAAAAMPTTVAEAAKGDSGAKPGASVGGAASGCRTGRGAAEPAASPAGRGDRPARQLAGRRDQAARPRGYRRRRPRRDHRDHPGGPRALVGVLREGHLRPL